MNRQSLTHLSFSLRLKGCGNNYDGFPIHPVSGASVGILYCTSQCVVLCCVVL